MTMIKLTLSILAVVAFVLSFFSLSLLYLTNSQLFTAVIVLIISSATLTILNFKN